MEFRNVIRLLKCPTKASLTNHPKLSVLQRLMLEHFSDHDNQDSKAMIFSQWRDSVEEIHQLLSTLGPSIRAMAFTGQARASNKYVSTYQPRTSTCLCVRAISDHVGGARKTGGISKKAQKEILTQFKAGQYNTLVCTSIGEEGIDIGEVDLIICFDAQESAIRTVQRRGRTGRRRDGRCGMCTHKHTHRERERERDYTSLH
jgi:ERCC4-related helicase